MIFTDKSYLPTRTFYIFPGGRDNDILSTTSARQRGRSVGNTQRYRYCRGEHTCAWWSGVDGRIATWCNVLRGNTENGVRTVLWAGGGLSRRRFNEYRTSAAQPTATAVAAATTIAYVSSLWRPPPPVDAVRRVYRSGAYY